MSQVKPHKHAKEIKAWADGAIIQYLDVGGKWADTYKNSPAWDSDTLYRIKPEPKPDVVLSGGVVLDSDNRDGIRIRNYFAQREGGQDNLKLIFDGETGSLKDAMVIKK